MNNQNEQGKEPQYLIDLENAAGSIDQVVKLLYCFAEICDEEHESANDSLENQERAFRSISFMERLPDYMSMVNVSCDSLENVSNTIYAAIGAIYSAHKKVKAVKA